MLLAEESDSSVAVVETTERASVQIAERTAPSVVWAGGRRQLARPLTPEEDLVVNDQQMNDIEAFLLSLPQTEYPLREIFVPKNGQLDSGMYVREVTLPAGVFFTTEIHATRHPYCLSKGHARVWTRQSGWTEVRAPYLGITEAPTRRLILTLSETIWSTYHAINETDPDKIKEAILIPHSIPSIDPRVVAETIGRIIRGEVIL